MSGEQKQTGVVDGSGSSDEIQMWQACKGNQPNLPIGPVPVWTPIPTTPTGPTSPLGCGQLINIQSPENMNVEFGTACTRSFDDCTACCAAQGVKNADWCDRCSVRSPRQSHSKCIDATSDQITMCVKRCRALPYPQTSSNSAGGSSQN
jgi:hypothetical protein